MAPLAHEMYLIVFRPNRRIRARLTYPRAT